MILFLDRVASPIGEVFVVSDGERLAAVEFGPPEERLLPLLRARYGAAPALREADDPQGFASALRAYFAGELDAVRGLPADGGGSPFQRRVWAALREIPAGRTESYGGLAARLGVPRASRAVGAANGRNPVSVVVPCHRVIGTGGALTGYGGGLERKRWLLRHEGALPPAEPQPAARPGVNGGGR
jgi:methylated-DNA-[protein]-cysteine S-methyltransferase